MNKSTASAIGLVALICFVVGILVGNQFSSPKTSVSFGGTDLEQVTQINFAQGFLVNGVVKYDNKGAFTQSQTSTLGLAYMSGEVRTGISTLTAAATTTTVTAAQICGTSKINWAPAANNSTATLPTTVTLTQACLPTAGNRITVLFTNTHATNTYNLVAGTGQTLFHLEESATSTSQGTTITSSTPIFVTFDVVLVSSTDSTANDYLMNMLRP